MKAGYLVIYSSLFTVDHITVVKYTHENPQRTT